MLYTAIVRITTIVLSINLNSGRFDFSLGAMAVLSSVLGAKLSYALLAGGSGSAAVMLLLILATLAVIVWLFDYSRFDNDYRALQAGQKVAVNTGIREIPNALASYGICGVLMGMVGFLSAVHGDALLLTRLEKTNAVQMVPPYMYHNYVDALITLGQTEKALSVLETYWSGMLDRGADTLYDHRPGRETDLPQHPKELCKLPFQGLLWSQ